MGKQPLVSGAAILSLALGIGANTTIFTLVNAVFFAQVPVHEPSRLVRIHNLEWEFPDRLTGISFRNYEDLRDGSTSFSGLAAYASTSVNLLPEGGEARQIRAQLVTADFFEILGVETGLGRTFLPEEDVSPIAVVVLSHGIWERQFGGDPAIIGKQINLSGRPFDVIGVTRPGFKGLQTISQPDLVWMPMAMHEFMLTGILGQYFELRRARFAQTIGRLKPGVSVERAHAEIHAIGEQLAEEFPAANRGREAVVRPYAPISPNQLAQLTRVAQLMLGVVGVVLLIACANVANLLLARAADREKEIAVRVALGAGRSRLVRQLLAESVTLALMAGVAGLGVAFWGRDLLWSYRPPNYADQSIDISFELPVLLCTLGVALLTGVLFGLVPALQVSNPDLRGALLAGGGRGTSGGNRAFLRKGLVVLEVALAVVSLTGAGLFIRSLQKAQSIDPGFETERLALLQLNVGNSGYKKAEAEQFYDELLSRLEALPAVESASLQSGRLLGGGIPHTTYPEGVDIADGLGRHVNDIVVTPGYFKTTGLSLVAGRLLTDFDRVGSARVAVINEATRRLFWPDVDPLGRRFTRSVEDFSIEVVGVVKDSLIDLGQSAQPIIFTPLRQFYQSAVQLQVRTRNDPEQSLLEIRSVIREIDSSLPILGVRTIAENMSEALWAPRMGAVLLGVFGVLALILAMIGIYGVMSYSVRQREGEIGLRMALGATGSRLVGLITRQGMSLVVAGVGLGIVLAVVSSRLLQSMLWGVSPTDPATLLIVTALMLGVSLLANLVPAFRLTRVDPLRAIQES